MDDLSRLPSFSEASVARALCSRYEGERIYTWVSSMLLALNPHAPLPLYTQRELRAHRVGEGGRVPHVFGVGAAAFKGMLGGRSQCVLVTGESGAGKTESCRRLLQFLGSSGKEGGEGGGKGGEGDGGGCSPLCESVATSEGVLEAFGNAGTLMNANSSRFGKFLSLRFCHGAMVGGSVRTYLLEKTRVVSHAPGERAFHVLYALIDGMGGAEARELFGQQKVSPSTFAYTAETDGGGGGYVGWRGVGAEERGEGGRLSQVGEALHALGVGQHEQWAIWRCLAAVLHLGNLQFEGGEATSVSGGTEESLQIAASLLGVSVEALRKSFVSRCIQARQPTSTRATTLQPTTPPP
ncbi:MAG: hypothetical protein SGPRY_009952 [Prymnesium sp.]